MSNEREESLKRSNLFAPAFHLIDFVKIWKDAPQEVILELIAALSFVACHGHEARLGSKSFKFASENLRKKLPPHSRAWFDAIFAEYAKADSRPTADFMRSMQAVVGGLINEFWDRAHIAHLDATGAFDVRKKARERDEGPELDFDR